MTLRDRGGTGLHPSTLCQDGEFCNYFYCQHRLKTTLWGMMTFYRCYRMDDRFVQHLSMVESPDYSTRPAPFCGWRYRLPAYRLPAYRLSTH